MNAPLETKFLDFVITSEAEVALLATRIRDIPGENNSTREEQYSMLVDLIHLASVALASRISGVERAIPLVRVTYRKVTDAKPRIEGDDFDKAPGLNGKTHVGRVIKVARNRKDNHIYLVLDDGNRRPSAEQQAKQKQADRKVTRAGLTAVRLEGLLSFEFVDPLVQRETLAALRPPVHPDAR